MSNRELDLLVAEKVMGAAWKRVHDEGPLRRVLCSPISMWKNYPEWDGKEELPSCEAGVAMPYSSDIAAAFLVVEKMREKYDVRFFASENDVSKDWHVLINSFERYGPSLPQCICEAALAAIAS